MAKQSLIQNFVVAGLSVAAIALVTEGYLRARAFVVQVHDSAREIAALKHEIATLQLTIDRAPRQSGTTLQAATALPVVQPIPEPMAILPLPSEAPRKVVPVVPKRNPMARDAAGAPDNDEDGPVVLLKPGKPSPTPAAKTPAEGQTGLDVRLLSDRK